MRVDRKVLEPWLDIGTLVFFSINDNNLYSTFTLLIPFKPFLYMPSSSMETVDPKSPKQIQYGSIQSTPSLSWSEGRLRTQMPMKDRVNL